MLSRPLKIGFAICLLAISASSLARAETLADALVSAYKNSGLLEQNRALLRAADEDVAGAVAALRPVVDYSLNRNYTSITETTSTNLDLSVRMTLFDFGRSKLRVDAAKENVLSLREALVGVEQNVLLGAVSAYASIRRDSAIVDLRENNVRLIRQELQAARDRFEVGEATRTDVAIAEARLAGAQSALAAAKGSLTRSKEQYRVSVGHFPGTLAGLPPAPRTAASLDAARSAARQRHPDILQAQRQVRLADINNAIAEAAMRPSLTGNARRSFDLDGAASSTVGLSISGPIYQGGALASASRKAAAQRDASRAGLHLTGLSVDQNVGNAWAQVTVANAAVAATNEQIRASRVALRGTREEASLGARTTLDVLNAEQELLDAEADRVTAQTDRYIAVYSLLAAMGLLTADHLGLGIVQYDPAAYYNAVKRAPGHNVSPQGQKLDHVLKSLGKF